MTKKLINFSLAFFLLIAYSSNAQTLKRTVLYTLETNEKVSSDEINSTPENYIDVRLINKQFIVEASDLDYKFVAVVYDTLKKKQALIFNGKRFKIDFFYGHLAYRNLPIFNILKPNGYAFAYIEGTETYINIFNERFGPFDDATLFTKDGEIGFSYKLFDKWYENLKGVVSGPFIGSTPHIGIDAVISNNHYAFYYFVDNPNELSSFYTNINGEIFGPFTYYCMMENQRYGQVDKIELTSDGGYGFPYCIEFEDFININDKSYGPYNGEPVFSIADSGLFMFSYVNLNQELYYLNINNKTIGPFEAIEKVEMFNNGSFAYIYTTSIIGKDGNKKIQKFLTINSNKYGPYDDISSFDISVNNSYYIEYQINEIKYVNNNGDIQKQNPISEDIIPLKTTEPIFNEFEYLEGEGIVLSSNKKHQLFYNKEIASTYTTEPNNYSFKYNYVVVDGKKYGKTVPINAKWNEERKSFIWNVIEEKELVVYELTFEN